MNINRPVLFSFLFGSGLIAAFGYYQVQASGLFYAGKVAAGRELLLWLSIAFFQCFLYFLCLSQNRKAIAAFAVSQICLLPLVGFLAISFLFRLPVAFLFFVTLVALFILTQFLSQLKRPVMLSQWQLDFSNLYNALARASIFALVTIITHATFCFFVLYHAQYRLSNFIFIALLALSGLLSYFICKSLKLNKISTLLEFLPISLLLFPLLRAKGQDNAYDTLLFKGTLPYLIADWRTCVTGVFDHTLLGTNFQEILNGIFKIIDHRYDAPFVSTISYLLLFFLLPALLRSFERNFNIPYPDWVRKVGYLSIFCLTESATAHGTSYHEPLMTLFMSSSLLSSPLALIFFSAAISVKLSVAFIIPLFAYLLWRARRALFEKKIIFCICGLLAFLTLAGQLYRNYEFTGRILAPGELASSITDPKGDILTKKTDIYSAGAGGDRGGIVNNFFLSSLNILGMDIFVKLYGNTPDEYFGFHVFPASRMNLLGLFFCLLALILCLWQRKYNLMVPTLLFAASYVLFLAFFTQGRYFLVPAFGAVLLFLLVAPRISFDCPARAFICQGLLAFLAAFIIFNDLYVGVNTNVGWNSNRNLLSPVQPDKFDDVVSPLDKCLKNLALLYRAQWGNKESIPPSIVAEHSVDRKPYLGAHYVYSFMSTDLARRYIAVDNERGKELFRSVLAFVVSDFQFIRSFYNGVRSEDFYKIYDDGKYSVYASRALTLEMEKAASLLSHDLGLFGRVNRARAIASESLYRKELHLYRQELQKNIEFVSRQQDMEMLHDFVKEWDSGILNPDVPQATPSGKGALRMALGIDPAKAGILLSPFALTFKNVPFPENAVLLLDAALVYPNQSDGMMVSIIVQTETSRKIVHQEIITAPKGEGHVVPIPKVIELPTIIGGRGNLILEASSSPSGDMNADWAAFRTLKIMIPKTKK